MTDDALENQWLMLDGNALAGVLREIFSQEMTTSPTACAHCGYEGEFGAMLAFNASPGLVLRCPSCEAPVLRIVKTSDALYLDARGAAYIRLQAAYQSA